MHKFVSKLTIIGSDNGLLPGQCQAIIWTNAWILSIRTLGTNFSDILSKIHIFSFTKMHLNVSSEEWRPCCLDPNVLTYGRVIHVRLSPYNNTTCIIIWKHAIGWGCDINLKKGKKQQTICEMSNWVIKINYLSTMQQGLFYNVASACYIVLLPFTVRCETDNLCW